MKVLVTGGAGYVGSVLIPDLLGLGYQVRALDNLMYGQDSLLGCFHDANFEFVKADVRDMAAVRAAARDVDLIIHLAAIVGAPACRAHEQAAREVNLQGTANVDEARGSGVGVVFASTGSVYGAVDGVCTEETSPNPLSVYGETKRDAERRLLGSGNVVVYRFATGFGLSPRLRLDLMVNDFTFQAVKNGFLLLYEKGFRRTFIHVRDMARAVIHAVENFDRMEGRVYNVGSESMNYTKEEVALAIREKVDYQVYYADLGSDPDQRDYTVSYARVREAGFEPRTSLERGIDELVAGCAMITLHNPYSNIES